MRNRALGRGIQQHCYKPSAVEPQHCYGFSATFLFCATFGKDSASTALGLLFIYICIIYIYILCPILSDIFSDIFSGIFCGMFSGIFWHSFWHSIWHLIWHSFWHLFRHSIQAFILASILKFYLMYVLTFYLAFFLPFYLTCIPTLCLAFYLVFCPAFYLTLSLACVRLQVWHDGRSMFPNLIHMVTLNCRVVLLGSDADLCCFPTVGKVP